MKFIRPICLVAFGVQGFISPHLYYLYVKIALEVKEEEEAAYFIKTYKSQLDPDIQEDMAQLCKAELHYSKGELDVAKMHLANFEGKEDFFYVLYRKVLNIKIFFDEKKLVTMEKELEALRIYPPKRSPDLNQSVRRLYLEFRRLAYYLWKCSIDPNAKHLISKLKVEIHTSRQLANRDWLQSRVDLLK